MRAAAQLAAAVVTGYRLLFRILRRIVVLLDLLLHEPTHLELDGGLLRHFHLVAGTGVARDAAGLGLRLKDSEVTEFKSVAFGKFVDDLIEEVLNHFLGVDLLNPCFFGNPLNQFSLGDGLHRKPPVSSVTIGTYD